MMPEKMSAAPRSRERAEVFRTVEMAGFWMPMRVIGRGENPVGINARRERDPARTDSRPQHLTMFSIRLHRRLVARVGLLSVVGLEACGSTTTDAGITPPAPSFALTIGASTISLAPGGVASTPIRAITAGGLTSGVTFAITGAPPGLSVAIVPTSVPDSATLTISAASGLAPAAYTLVVNATAPGALAQQASLVVAVGAPVGGSVAVKSVVTGALSCALTSAGAAYCWGYDADGRLGDNETRDAAPTPVAVAGGLTFQSLAVSKVAGVSCGLDNVGAAYCWGDNTNGQLGDGGRSQHATPTLVAGGLKFVNVSVGSSHVCGVATNASAYCWGSTVNGAFGDGSVGTHLVPTVTAPGMDFQSIAVGSDYTCALTTDGSAYCWGLGVFGQLGNDSGFSSTTPVAVSGGLTFRSLVAGGLAACGLTTTGKAYCWGQNFYGTLGNGSSATDGGAARSVTPVEVAGGLKFTSLSAGYETMCGIAMGGAAYCWGYNFGAVGDGTPDHRSMPVAVAGGLTFKSISSGTGYTCGITTSDALYCWGDNSNGELGDGTLTARLSPAAVRWP